MGSQPGALREIERQWLAAMPGWTGDETGRVEGQAILAHVDALVASLTAARQERDGAQGAYVRLMKWAGIKEGVYGLINPAAEELAAARQREQQLTQALTGYHNLSQSVADCVNECGEQLLYADLFAANKVAHAVLTGEAPPTAPPESVRQEQPDADAELRSLRSALREATASRDVFEAIAYRKLDAAVLADALDAVAPVVVAAEECAAWHSAQPTRHVTDVRLAEALEAHRAACCQQTIEENLKRDETAPAPAAVAGAPTAPRQRLEASATAAERPLTEGGNP